MDLECMPALDGVLRCELWMTGLTDISEVDICKIVLLAVQTIGPDMSNIRIS